MTVPAGKEIVTSQRGLDAVYELAESATALEVSQSPSSDTLPDISMVSPYVVDASSSKVTATVVAVAQEVEVVLVEVVLLVEVVVPVPELGVWEAGHVVGEAVENVPMADVEEQVAGTLEAVVSPQEYGTTFALRAAAVKKAA